MQQPKIPENESKRLGALRELNILDTAPEERFDRLTMMAKRMFDVPMALVSLVDANRQWFKSHPGLDTSELGRDVSFCGHAILGEDIFLIPDAALDDRFRDNPMVSAYPKIRFYAGIPLRHHTGSKLGTLCIMDVRPRELGPEGIQDLRYLAEMVEKELAAGQMATIDLLTGLANRRGFLALANKSLNLCRRQKLPSTLSFMDIDSFREINDYYGSDAGDRALKSFTQLLKEGFRDSDIIGRVGDDEFLVLLNSTSLKPAEKVIQGFAKTLEVYNRTTDHPFTIQFAWGAINIPPENIVDLNELIDKADAEMRRQERQAGFQRRARAEVPAWKAIDYYRS